MIPGKEVHNVEGLNREWGVAIAAGDHSPGYN